MDNSQFIDAYSRSEAIRDGVLIDISDKAKQAGIKYPVAITQAVDSFISRSIESNRNDYQGIVSDILTCFRFSARSNQSDIMIFKVLIWNNEIQNNKMVEFKATIGPGDTAEPVITIMFPSED